MNCACFHRRGVIKHAERVYGLGGTKVAVSGYALTPNLRIVSDLNKTTLHGLWTELLTPSGQHSSLLCLDARHPGPYQLRYSHLT